MANEKIVVTDTRDLEGVSREAAEAILSNTNPNFRLLLDGNYIGTEHPALLITPLADALGRSAMDATPLLPNIQIIDIGCGSLGLLDLPVGE